MCKYTESQDISVESLLISKVTSNVLVSNGGESSSCQSGTTRRIARHKMNRDDSTGQHAKLHPKDHCGLGNANGDHCPMTMEFDKFFSIIERWLNR
jgi:hypothetical protein